MHRFALVLAAGWLVASAGHTAGQGLEVEIAADNCPVYAAPRADAQQIVYTIHRGSRYPVLETRRTEESALFYRIRYGQRDSDTGWVHGEWAQVRARSTRAEVPAAGAAATERELHTRILRLVEVYNEEKTSLTVDYGLRPFPSFAVDLAPEHAARLLVEPRKIRVPLVYAHEEKLSLERSTKFLLQLIMRECFALGATPDEVEVAIRFTSGSSVTLSYRAGDWERQGRGGLDEFWNGIVGNAKNALWQ